MPVPSIDAALAEAMVHHRAGRLAEAEAIYLEVLDAEPEHPDALHLLGMAMHQSGRHEPAVELMRRALDQRPAAAEYRSNLGVVLTVLGRHGEAVAELRLAISQQPDFAPAYFNLGNALSEQGGHDEAIPVYRAALALRPQFAKAHTNLANALRELGQHDEARGHYHAALSIEPQLAEAHNGLGHSLLAEGRLVDAADRFTTALAHKPDLVQARHNLASVCWLQGRLDGAIAAYRDALARNPDDAVTRSNLIYTLHFDPAASMDAIAVEQLEWSRRHAEPLRPSIVPHDNPRDPSRRLKVGYVSPDFRDQAEAFFVLPLLEAHDRDEVEVHLYSSVHRPGVLTERHRRAAGAWHDVATLPHEALAAQIRADGIDILVDLTMHMAQNRLLAFARQPAPLQVAWLAYPGSTGLPTIAYRLTDAIIDPPPAPGAPDAAWSTEQPIRLPDAWCCYDPLDDTPHVNDLPALSSPGSAVRFASLNNPCKHNPAMLRRWARVLAAVPNATLLLLSPEGEHRKGIAAHFTDRGVDAGRIEFVAMQPRFDYLQIYNSIDIGLDPFPYSGITTTCDALWMGVPVLTVPGATPTSRAAHSLLAAVGLKELVSDDEDAFVQGAAALAGDLPRLAALRRSLRERMRASPLMDAPRFARHVEAAYRAVWRRWCSR